VKLGQTAAARHIEGHKLLNNRACSDWLMGIIIGIKAGVGEDARGKVVQIGTPGNHNL